MCAASVICMGISGISKVSCAILGDILETHNGTDMICQNCFEVCEDIIKLFRNSSVLLRGVSKLFRDASKSFKDAIKRYEGISKSSW